MSANPSNPIYTIQSSTLTGLADAIRAKTGRSEAFTPAQMISAISNIETGGSSESGTPSGIDLSNCFYALYSDPNDGSGDSQEAYCPVTSSTQLTSEALLYKLFVESKSIYAANLGPIEIIGEGAFSTAYYLESISMPNVTAVGGSAFAGCAYLQEIALPRCSDIGVQAFAYCSTLQSISLPNCEAIGQSAFEGCESLWSLSLPNVMYLDTMAFDSAYISSITIGLSDGSDFSFGAVRYIENVAFPNLTYMPSNAFADGEGSGSIAYVSIPACSYIGEYAFSGQHELSYVNASFCTSIESFAFYDCQVLHEVVAPNVTFIGSSAFEGCTELTAAAFSRCSEIYEYAFAGCNSIYEIYMPLVSALSEDTFARCGFLTSVDFPMCTTIGSNCFYSCALLECVSIPMCSEIDAAAFTDCYAISSVYLNGYSSICSITGEGYEPTAYDVFSGIQNESWTVYVPASLATAYKNDSQWSMISDHIVGMSSMHLGGTN